MEERFKKLENHLIDFFKWEKLGFKYNKPSLVGSLIMYRDLSEDTRVAIDFKYANADSDRPGLFIGVNAYVVSNKINKIIFEASGGELCQDTSSIRNLKSHLITKGMFDPDYYNLNYIKQ